MKNSRANEKLKKLKKAFDWWVLGKEDYREFFDPREMTPAKVHNPYDYSDKQLKENLLLNCWNSTQQWTGHGLMVLAILNDRSSRRSQRASILIALSALIVSVVTLLR